MRHFPHLSAFFALLFMAGSAMGEANDSEWVSYRDAYRMMVVFDKYGAPKNLIQNHYQVMAKDGKVAPDGVQLTLKRGATRQRLALDATGRALLPMVTQAYKENAVLVLNRKVSDHLFRPRVSIVLRADGVYETGKLRAACEQALAYQRHVDASPRATRCVGVRFVFPHGMADPGVRGRKGDGELLSISDGPAFPGDPYQGFRIVKYLFGDAPAKSNVVTQNAPLAIDPMYE